MLVKKEQRIVIYKSNQGKLDVFLNVDGVNFKTTVFPNVEDDMSVRSWGGNLYKNEQEEE